MRNHDFGARRKTVENEMVEDVTSLRSRLKNLRTESDPNNEVPLLDTPSKYYFESK